MMRTMRMVDVIHQQAAGKNARAKNHNRRQNDFPEIHGDWSLWSTEARSVVSKFWERWAFVVVAAGEKKDHTLNSKEMATQETAARQSPRTQTSAFCGATRV